MSKFATIYSWPGNPRLFRTLAAAKLNGLEIELAGPPEFQFGVTNKEEGFRSKFPLGKVPALETSGPSPVRITEAAAIAFFVADSGPARDTLLGSTAEERGHIQEWIFHSEHEIFPQVLTGARPARGLVPFVKETDDTARANFDRIIKVVEKQLSENEWIAGTRSISLADLTVASHLFWAFKFWIGEAGRAEIPKTVAWYKNVIGSEVAQGIWPEQEWKA